MQQQVTTVVRTVVPQQKNLIYEVEEDKQMFVLTVTLLVINGDMVHLRLDVQPDGGR